MATAVTANRAELIAIANSVATEKMIDKAIVIDQTPIGRTPTRTTRTA